jgi:hypothetical protein
MCVIGLLLVYYWFIIGLLCCDGIAMPDSVRPFSFRRLLQYVAHHRGVLRHLLGRRFGFLRLYEMPR